MKHAEIPARNERLCVEYASGSSLNDIAAQFNLGSATVYQLLRKAGINPKFCKAKVIQLKRERFPSKRAIEMAHRFFNGETLHAIGQHFNLTRERVRQILSERFDITKSDGGHYRRSTEHRVFAALNKVKRHDLAFANLVGVSKDVYKDMTGERAAKCSAGPAVAYRDQKRNAKIRGIPFELTFTEWWKVWRESGMYAQRGRGHGYVMARIGDTDGYKVGNIMICTSAQNAHDQYFSGKSRKRVINIIATPRTFGAVFFPDDALMMH